MDYINDDDGEDNDLKACIGSLWIGVCEGLACPAVLSVCSSFSPWWRQFSRGASDHVMLRQRAVSASVSRPVAESLTDKLFN